MKFKALRKRGMGWVKRTPSPEKGVKRPSSGGGCGYT